MAEHRSELAPVQFPRGGGSKAVLWLDMWQVIGAGGLLMAFMGVIFISSATSWSWFSVLVMVLLLIAVAGTIVNVSGRPLPWWIKQRYRSIRQRGKSQDNFVAQAPSQRELAADEEAEEAAIAAGVPAPVRLRLPGEAAELRLYTLDGGSALVWDPVTKTATVIARVSPHGFRMAEPEDQADVIINWSAMLDSLYAEPGVIAVQASDTITTASAAEIRAAYERQVQEARSNGMAAGPDLSPLLHNDYLGLLTGDRSQVQHDDLAAITISQPAVREQVKSNGGGIPGLLSVMRRAQQEYEDLLHEANVDVMAWLDADALSAITRRAFIPDEAVAITEGRTVVTAATAGPMGVDVEWDRLRVDGAWHRVLEISQWPTRPEKPGFMRHLNSGDFPHVVTQIIRPQGVNAGMKKVQDRLNDQHSAAVIRQQMGQSAKLTDAAVNTDLDRTGQELLAGHGMARFMGLVVVSGSSEDELETNTKRMISGATRAGCELRTLYGQQWPGFLSSAVPLGRGLIKAK
ncbi:hypothetical protein FCK90_08600 [Kocuria coralli]|uniref:PrgI family protein n=1 Tax=Kocuria coralli TaxID=1461025 RepID=A0A5J5KZ95_9MICC|nr:SCO6880 family protein [Kocuria coralli]KAA9394166.1 hypothetical protein FCK90_08600 [Kocuria coralli]